jgi:uncharacterized protein (TIGR02217 family)
MSFDEVQFPPEIALGASGGPVFNTSVVRTAGGREIRVQNWSTPLRRYNVGSAVKPPALWAALLSFYVARDGQARGFRFKDWSDYTSAADGVSDPVAADQVIGTGDGVRTVWPLIKTYSSGGQSRVRNITKPVSGSVVVTVNGSPASPTISTTAGTLTFGSPVTAGHVIRAGYRFDVPVRFGTDVFSLGLPIAFAGEWPDIILQEVRV